MLRHFDFVDFIVDNVSYVNVWRQLTARLTDKRAARVLHWGGTEVARVNFFSLKGGDLFIVVAALKTTRDFTEQSRTYVPSKTVFR